MLTVNKKQKPNGTAPNKPPLQKEVSRLAVTEDCKELAEYFLLSKHK
jgi:hypothetical protein